MIMLPTSASSLNMGTRGATARPPNAQRQMALLRHRRSGPPLSSAIAGVRAFRGPPEMPHASDETRRVPVARQLKLRGETDFHHNDTARRTWPRIGVLRFP